MPIIKEYATVTELLEDIIPLFRLYLCIIKTFNRDATISKMLKEISLSWKISLFL